MRKLECRVSLRGVACVADVKRGRGSRIFLGSNTAGRETHEPTTRRKRATNKQKI